MNKMLLAMAVCLLACATSHAERADSLKKITIEADSSELGTVNQSGWAEGNVVVKRGTLLMKAGKMTLTEDPEGYKFVTLLAAPGALATFRQKRDGGPDLWVEGEAERIEFDDKTDIVKLMGRAKVKNLDGARVTNGAEGAFIAYDNRKEVSTLRNTATGQSKTGGGRVQIIIDQKPHPIPAAAPAGKQ
jgi:lipopolysaccharide export system protein LptA